MAGMGLDISLRVTLGVQVGRLNLWREDLRSLALEPKRKRAAFSDEAERRLGPARSSRIRLGVVGGAAALPQRPPCLPRRRSGAFAEGEVEPGSGFRGSTSATQRGSGYAGPQAQLSEAQAEPRFVQA